MFVDRGEHFHDFPTPQQRAFAKKPGTKGIAQNHRLNPIIKGRAILQIMARKYIEDRTFESRATAALLFVTRTVMRVMASAGHHRMIDSRQDDRRLKLHVNQRDRIEAEQALPEADVNQVIGSFQLFEDPFHRNGWPLFPAIEEIIGRLLQAGEQIVPDPGAQVWPVSTKGTDFPMVRNRVLRIKIDFVSAPLHHRIRIQHEPSRPLQGIRR